MKVSIGVLKGFELELAFHFATGYSGFEFYPEYSCWRVEKKFGDSGLLSVSIINDDCGCFTGREFNKDFSDETILRELRSENIGLKWDDDSNYVLYFQALPEITASSPSLMIAFMKVMILKELGEVLSDDAVESMNLFKTRKKKGKPL